MNTSYRVCILSLMSLALCSATFAHDESRVNCPSKVLVEWNEQILAVAAAEDGLLTLKGVRTAAMMHLAVHDSINSIRRHYAHYAFRGDGTGADPVATAAHAAFEIAVSQYPKQRPRFERLLRPWDASARDEDARRRSAELGLAAAREILAMRDGDGWDREAEYRWHPMGPGVYAEFPEHSATPNGFVFGAGWASVKPFALRRPDQFRVPPPPAISSNAYVIAYDEVRELGRFKSRTRTADQTHQALWWKDFAESSHNRLARALVNDRDTDLWTAARMFALLNISIFDGYIASFDSKFAYNHWRPYTAIRWADRDGNRRTVAEPDWTNTHQHTYAFPSYPSAHGTVCAAGMSVLADTFGARQRFTMVTREVNAAGPFSPLITLRPATRSFESFGDAAMECALSRVYLGIHFRYDSLAGNSLGATVGRYAVERLLESIQ
jgi:membrane-associated phospholipid phosphatase